MPVTATSEPDRSTEGLQATWLAAIARLAAHEGIELPSPPIDPAESGPAWARRANLPEILITRTNAHVLNVPFVESLPELRPSVAYLRQLSIAFSRRHCVLAFSDEEGRLTLAMPDHQAWPVLDMIGRLLRTYPMPIFAPREQILQAINRAYEQSSQPDAVLNAMSHEGAQENWKGLESIEDLLATEGQAPVVELVNLLLLEAVKGGASDIHFQPYREKLVVRYRIDGVLFDAHTLPKAVQEEAISRVKVLGKMNIAEKRLPQDGRATVTVGDRLIDLRIASLPGSYGERVVLRLLDKSARLYTLDEIGMNSLARRRFRELIDMEHGLILLTGPTGSGKTTTLYAALQEINTRDRNVVTLEDPIEYNIDGISQTQTNVKKGLTFAVGLRNVLRQDPDIIMVGEIRDNETAVMAIQAALTGHLVFSTLHTNDAASAVTRLLDLGIEPYLVSSSLLAVLAQRLVRKVCQTCGHEVPWSEDDIQRLGVHPSAVQDKPYRTGRGCAACRETGYRGRLAICEMLVVDESIREKIQDRSSAAEIREVACGRGMTLLRDDVINKVLAGVTTPSEVMRVTVRTNL